jgi:hypothetical protein
MVVTSQFVNRLGRGRIPEREKTQADWWGSGSVPKSWLASGILENKSQNFGVFCIRLRLERAQATVRHFLKPGCGYSQSLAQRAMRT